MRRHNTLIPAAKLGTQQAWVGCLKSEPSNSRELLVDGIRRQAASFLVHALANDHDAIECQSGLGAVRGNELVDAVSAKGRRMINELGLWFTSRQ
jgi:hypothetical protein